MVYFFAGSEVAASSWDGCRGELAARGIASTAVSYDASDWARGYDTAISELASGVSPGAVLVGHSLAGLFLPVLGERIRAAAEVYIAALVPRPRVSFTEQIFDDGREVFTAEWSSLHGARTLEAQAAAQGLLFGECPPGSAEAYQRPMENVSVLYDLPCPLAVWPHRQRFYLSCIRDRTIEPAWQRYAAKECLGVDAIELEAGHLPHVSMPHELARRLAALLENCTCA